jgi:predicted ABC-type ATPase
MAINLGTDLKGRIVTAQDAWAITKEEAANINVALRLAVTKSESRKNIIYDATGQNLNLYTRIIRNLKVKGYDVQVYYVDVNLKVTKERVTNRAEINGRFIAKKAMDEMYYQSKGNFRSIAAEADSAFILDNRETPPPKVASQFDKGKCIGGEDYLNRRKF